MLKDDSFALPRFPKEGFLHPDWRGYAAGTGQRNVKQGVALDLLTTHNGYKVAVQRMGLHDNRGHLASHALGVTAGKPWKNFTYALIEEDWQTYVAWLDTEGVPRTGWMTAFGWVEPAQFSQNPDYVTGLTVRAVEAGWTLGINPRGQEWVL